MRGGDGLERVDAFLARLADPDEDAGRERDDRAAGRVERREAAFGCLVGGAVVRAAGFAEPRRQRLDHHPLRRAHRAQPFELRLAERARIGVREQPGLVEHELRGGDQVVDRGSVAVGRERLGGLRVARLGRFAQREQGFEAAQRRAPRRELQNFVDRHVRRVEAPGEVQPHRSAQHGRLFPSGRTRPRRTAHRRLLRHELGAVFEQIPPSFERLAPARARLPAAAVPNQSGVARITAGQGCHRPMRSVAFSSPVTVKRSERAMREGEGRKRCGFSSLQSRPPGASTVIAGHEQRAGPLGPSPRLRSIGGATTAVRAQEIVDRLS